MLAGNSLKICVGAGFETSSTLVKVHLELLTKTGQCHKIQIMLVNKKNYRALEVYCKKTYLGSCNNLV